MSILAEIHINAGVVRLFENDGTCNTNIAVIVGYIHSILAVHDKHWYIELAHTKDGGIFGSLTVDLIHLGGK